MCGGSRRHACRSMNAQNAYYGPQQTYWGVPAGATYGPGPGHGQGWGNGYRGRGWGGRNHCHQSLVGFVAGRIQERQASRLAYQQGTSWNAQAAPQQYQQHQQTAQPDRSPSSYNVNVPYRKDEPQPTNKTANNKEDPTKQFKDDYEAPEGPPPRYSVVVGQNF